MNTKAFLEESIKKVFESEQADKTNQSASFYLSKALYHLREVELFLSGATDPKIKNDIGEEAYKVIRDINVHGSLEDIKKRLSAIKQK